MVVIVGWFNNAVFVFLYAYGFYRMRCVQYVYTPLG